MRKAWSSLGVALVVAGAGAAGAHTLAVDMDLGTPGIQSSALAAPGSTLSVGIVLVDDGVGVVSGFGISLSANGAGPVVAFASPTVAGPLSPGHADLVTGAGVGPGVPLASAGLPPAGGFSDTDGGVGHFDPSGAGIFGIGPFGAPGVEHLLTTVDLLVVGPGGSSTSLVPSGILPIGGGPGAPADPKAAGPLGPGGAAFWDADFFSGIGGYAPTAVTPGSLTVTPEPAIFVSLLFAFLLLGMVRRRYS